MSPHAPFLLVRARPADADAERFDRWFRDVHFHDARRIPGFTEVQLARTAAGTRLGLYTFESADVVKMALQSPEAAYARGTWEQWVPDLEELSMEIFAPLFTLPIYEAAN